jgi:hypothetical protein
MSAAKAVNARLTTVTAVTDLVADRVYPIIAPQNARTYPQVVYQISGEEHPGHYTGTSGLGKATVTVACIARSYAGSVELAAAVRVALDQQAGTWGSVVVKGCFFEDADEQQDANDQGQDDLLFLKVLTFTIWVGE